MPSRALGRPVLVINLSDSFCAQCGAAAFPHELTHDTEPRFSGVHAQGCGVRWRFVSTSYTGDAEAATKAKRPDLLFVPFFDIRHLPEPDLG